VIKISLHLESKGKLTPEAYLETLAENYWKDLNQKINGNYTENALVSVIENYRDQALALDPDYVDKYANNDGFISLIQGDFFDCMLENSVSLLKKIIVSEPAGLESIKAQIKAEFPDEIFFTTSKSTKTQTEFGRLLSEEIFNYRKFRSSKICLDYLGNLSFEEVYCPYCGYELLELVEVSPGDTDIPEKALLDLDHFFSKAEFPYLSISLFNLIPCCHKCNSRYKLTKEFSITTHVHPYIDSFEDYFTFSIQTTPGGRRIFVDPVGQNKKDNMVRDLGIDKRYKKKKDLLMLETDYNSISRYQKNGTIEEFVKYMLKNVPRSRSEILCESFGKAKRDILNSIDVFNVLKPHIN